MLKVVDPVMLLRNLLFVLSFAGVAYCLRFSLNMKSGGHGVDFKYIPIHNARETENFPRIVQIAGIYPDLSADDLLAPPQSLPVRRGILYLLYFRFIC